MKIIDKIRNKNENLREGSPVTIAFLGDSVTQGCFECYYDNNGRLQTLFDYSKAYSTRVKEILNRLYPSAQINIINSGISGDNARGGKNRFDRDIGKYSRDLCVISFGLNDSGVGLDKLDEYIANLNEIFDKAEKIGCECIFLTENYMCTKVSDFLLDERARNLARNLSRIQNEGILKAYFDAAKELANKRDVKVCDMYSIWEKMNENGIDTTSLLSNMFNHPIKDMHYYTAIKLVETMFE